MLQVPAPRTPPRPPGLLSLPPECLREVASRLSDEKDLTSASGACRQLHIVCREPRVWRDLTRFHFTAVQIEAEVSRGQKHAPDQRPAWRGGAGRGHEPDWREVYRRLRRAHGLPEDRLYAETLSLCRHCGTLFWRSTGHPCFAEQSPEFQARLQEAGKELLPPHPVPPQAFLKFFSL